MIELLNDKSKVDGMLKSHFKSYHISDDPFEKIAVYTAEDIIGVISYSIIYERGEINYIVVSDNERRNGIGSKLLEYALNDIKNSGSKIVSLEVEEENMPAINLYLKNGFVKNAIRENYYGNKNAILMIKDLR